MLGGVASTGLDVPIGRAGGEEATMTGSMVDAAAFGTIREGGEEAAMVKTGSMVDKAVSDTTGGLIRATC